MNKLQYHSDYIAYSFHNKLKIAYSYLKEKVNKRVDFMLNVLLQIEEDNLFSYSRKCQLPVAGGKGSRHQCAMAIPAGDVEVILLI